MCTQGEKNRRDGGRDENEFKRPFCVFIQPREIYPLQSSIHWQLPGWTDCTAPNESGLQANIPICYLRQKQRQEERGRWIETDSTQEAWDKAIGTTAHHQWKGMQDRYLSPWVGGEVSRILVKGPSECACEDVSRNGKLKEKDALSVSGTIP